MHQETGRLPAPRGVRADICLSPTAATLRLKDAPVKPPAAPLRDRAGECSWSSPPPVRIFPAQPAKALPTPARPGNLDCAAKNACESVAKFHGAIRPQVGTMKPTLLARPNAETEIHSPDGRTGLLGESRQNPPPTTVSLCAKMCPNTAEKRPDSAQQRQTHGTRQTENSPGVRARPSFGPAQRESVLMGESARVVIAVFFKSAVLIARRVCSSEGPPCSASPSPPRILVAYRPTRRQRPCSGRGFLGCP
ncbi:hypothetical protein LSM04_004542 [Trypanosoma melophagium]|uniref:uncharacterized protein n=1 Tax=Trypanosoma melophagium TaxID=715481 RepID=UPI003519F5B5|nr:hypothetical protein LSM04_004542 [Trypanosoma melophagium]